MTLTDTRRVGAISLGITLVALYIANITGNAPDESGGVAFLFVSLAICAAIAYWLFGRMLPQAIEAGPTVAAKRALVLAGVSAVAWGLFWSGVPFVTAPAAIALGVSARTRGGGGMATAAIVIGTIVLLAAAGMIVADELDAV